MTSILTNTASMSALQTLRSINSQMTDTQNRISSGLRVESAADNAAYWSIATTMRSDSSSLSAVSDALGIGASKVGVASAGMNSAIDIVGQIKDKLVTAKESSADKEKIQADISQLQAQLKGVAKSASFSGANWLNVDSGGTAPGTQKIVASVTRDSAGDVAVGTIDVDTSDVVLIDAGSAANGLLSKDRTGSNSTSVSVAGGSNDIKLTSSTTSDQIDDMISAADKAMSDMTNAAGKLGSVSKRISMQDGFVSKLKDAIDTGVGRLVDADMSKESTRLQALQVQQQLAIQSLSMANAQPQSILALFR